MFVKGLEGESQPDVRHTIQWEAKSEPKAVAEPFVVIVKPNFIRGSENFFAELPSYKGEGISLKAAYDDALERAVKPVVAQIRREDEDELSAPAPASVVVESQPVFPSEETMCAY